MCTQGPGSGSVAHRARRLGFPRRIGLRPYCPAAGLRSATPRAPSPAKSSYDRVEWVAYALRSWVLSSRSLPELAPAEPSLLHRPRRRWTGAPMTLGRPSMHRQRTPRWSVTPPPTLRCPRVLHRSIRTLPTLRRPKTRNRSGRTLQTPRRPKTLPPTIPMLPMRRRPRMLRRAVRTRPAVTPPSPRIAAILMPACRRCRRTSRARSSST